MLDFLIVFELKARELQSVVLLGAELEARGYSVRYVQMPFAPKHLFPLMSRKARVVVAPAAYDDQCLYWMVYRYSRAAKKIVNLQWEQVRSVAAEEDLNHFYYPSQTARQVVHLCWGERSKSRLVASGIEPTNAAVVGPPHLDFIRPEFRDWFMERETLFKEFSLDPSTRTILFISSFSYATLTERDVQDVKANLDEVEVDQFRAISTESQSALFEWVDRLLSTVKDINFIYRKHPAERDSPFLAKMSMKHANFTEISAHSVEQWILCCDEIVAWYSTAVAAAFFAGKPFSIVRPLHLPAEREVSIMVGGRFLTTYAAFEDSLRTRQPTPIEEATMKKYYSFSPTKMSYERVADELERVLKDRQATVEWDADVLRRMRNQLRGERTVAARSALARRLGGVMRRLRVASGATLSPVPLQPHRAAGDRVSRAELASMRSNARALVARLASR